jgi:hypothetical protein
MSHPRVAFVTALLSLLTACSAPSQSPKPPTSSPLTAVLIPSTESPVTAVLIPPASCRQTPAGPVCVGLDPPATTTPGITSTEN